MPRTATARPDILDTLAQGIATLTSSAEWMTHLATQARFHKYSFGNVRLIGLQRPDATRVAGFHRWLELGRHVRKGEHGIRILAPVTRRVAEEEPDQDTTPERRLVGWRGAVVFDVAQTEGQDLPETPCHRLTGDDPDNILEALLGVADRQGYSVEMASFRDTRNGDYDTGNRHIRIGANLAPAQKAKTLAHELSHAAMGHETYSDRALAELEAESSAFVILNALGIDSGSYTFGYVAHWAGGGEAAIAGIKTSGARIQHTAKHILDALDTPESPAGRPSRRVRGS